MGNQQGKVAVKRPPSQYPFTDTEKRSRTDWTAGVPLAPGKPIVQLSPRTAPLDENSVTDEINLTWAVPKDDGGYPITGYRIEMLDIQTNHWIEITFIEGFEPRCTLSNILYGIMYRFRVIAYNDAGPSEPGDPSDPVVIDVPGVQIAPYFVLMLNDTIALEHERVEFKVKVLGTPKPTVQWYKDDMEVFSSDRLEIREEEDGGTVIVKEARLSDSGNIKCVATNILGRATSIGQLIIEAAPRLDLPETYNDGLIFRYDEVIRLKIPLIAKPPPRITWYFDDEPICASEDVSIETTENMTSLKIGAAKRWHCGEFRVLAQNENGEDAASILVTVTAPPSPAGKPVVIDITGTTCTLRWEPVQDDGGADVKHYIVEYFRDVWDVWLKAKTTKEGQVTIEDLIPGSRYKFRIKAENAYGISEESEESDPFDVGGVQNQDVRNQSSLPEEGWSSPQEVWPASPRGPKLEAMKQAWDSGESSEDMLKSHEDVLKDLLRVKKLSQRVSSVESDGLPSIASVDLGEDMSLSESSDLQKARKLYAELQAMSIESTGSTEDMPDLDAAAREFYMEIRALSMETGGSIENILDHIGASSESLASLIPMERRQELANFEMSLKQMIEEARQLAASPARELLPEEDIHDARTPVPEPDLRGRKSLSATSQPESVVSVLEAAAPPPGRGRHEEEEEPEPRPMAERGRPTERRRPPLVPPPVPEARLPPSPPEPSFPPPIQGRATAHLLHEQESMEEQAPPLEEMEPPPPPRAVSAAHVISPPPAPSVKAATPQIPGRRGQVINREPSVGTDRYEDIIVEARKRSQSRGPGSRMGSRTSSQMDFRTSQSDFTPPISHSGRLDLDSIRNSTRSLTTASLDLETRLQQQETRPASAARVFGPSQPRRDSPQSAPQVTPPPPTTIVKAQAAPRPVAVVEAASYGKVALDANQNATPATLPSSAPPTKRRQSRQPDPLVEMFPKNIPHWFVITYTYSVVLIIILLIANSTPDGKLYIHFTAFWSLVLYFMLEDEQASDILDSVVEGFLIGK